MILLETVHGSHLYGLAHAESDVDTFRVFANKPGRKKARNAKQRIDGDDDSLTTDLSTFMQYAEKGVPQYLEAMWSDMATVDEIHDLRFSFYPNPYQVEKTYVRTIRNFWIKDDYKRSRHAWRLYYNLLELKARGQFNPTLSPAQAQIISSLAHDRVPPPVDLEVKEYQGD